MAEISMTPPWTSERARREEFGRARKPAISCPRMNGAKEHLSKNLLAPSMICQAPGGSQASTRKQCGGSALGLFSY